MRCGNPGGAIGIYMDITSENKPVAAGNQLFLRIPNQKLATWRIHQIEFINVAGFSSATPRRAKSDFPKASDFPHDVGRAVSVHNVYLIVPFVGLTHETFSRQFSLKQFYVNWIYDFFYHAALKIYDL